MDASIVNDDGYLEGYDTGYFAGLEAALKVIRQSESQSKLGLVNELERVYMEGVLG